MRWPTSKMVSDVSEFRRLGMKRMEARLNSRHGSDGLICVDGALFFLGYENGCGEGGDGGRSGFGIEAGLASGGVAGALLHGVQVELEALQASVVEVDL